MNRRVYEVTYWNTASAISMGVKEEDLVTLVLKQFEEVKRLREGVQGPGGKQVAGCIWRDQGEGESSRPSPSLRNEEGT